MKWCLTVNLDFGAEIVMEESMKLQVLQFLMPQGNVPLGDKGAKMLLMYQTCCFYGILMCICMKYLINLVNLWNLEKVKGHFLHQWNVIC